MELIALTLFILSTSGTPGPNNVMILTSGVNHGIRRSIPHILGVNIGFPIMIVCVGLGIMSLFKQWPILHQIIQAIGIFYLAYLAIKIATMPVNSDLKDKSKPMSFIQAAVFQWVNPKAWVMSVSAIVAFSVPDMNIYQQVFIISAFYFVVGLPCSLAWLFTGKWLSNILSNHTYVRRFNIAMALLLLSSIIPMVQDMLTTNI